MSSMQAVEERLKAWGIYMRDDRRALKRPVLSQCRYGEELPDVYVEEDEYIEFYFGQRLVRVPVEMAEVTNRLIGGMHQSLQRVLWIAYVEGGRPEICAAKLGVGRTVWYERLREAKLVYGYVWAEVIKGVSQEGVVMHVEGCPDACNDNQ